MRQLYFDGGGRIHSVGSEEAPTNETSFLWAEAVPIPYRTGSFHLKIGGGMEAHNFFQERKFNYYWDLKGKGCPTCSRKRESSEV